jgi:hypothetical protein
MMPSVIYETLAGDSLLAGLLGWDGPIPIPEKTRIFELQSCDERPLVDNGFFIIIDFQETPMIRRRFGPQIMQVWVHTPMEAGADYGTITKILNRIDKLIMPLELVIGNDGVRLTLVEQHGRSENTIDPGWKTATRNGLYGVLYDEASA